MPGFDGSGPYGDGPRGRGFGPCRNSQTDLRYGRGFGRRGWSGRAGLDGEEMNHSTHLRTKLLIWNAKNLFWKNVWKISNSY